MLHGIHADGINPHVKIHLHHGVHVILHHLILGLEIHAIAGHAAELHFVHSFPVVGVAHVIPLFRQVVLHCRIPEVPGIDALVLIHIAGYGYITLGKMHGKGGFGIGVAGAQASVPGRSYRIVVIAAVNGLVIADILLVDAHVNAVLAVLGINVVLGGDLFDPGLTADTIVGGVVDHYVLHYLDALGMSSLDEVKIGGSRAFQTEIRLEPVIGMIAVVVETGTVFYRRSNPDGSEAHGLDIVQRFDKALEVSSPAGIRGVKAVSVIVVVALIAVLVAGSQHKVDGLIAEVGGVKNGAAFLDKPEIMLLLLHAVVTHYESAQSVGRAQTIGGSILKLNGAAVLGGLFRRLGIVQSVVNGTADSVEISILQSQSNGLILMIAAGSQICGQIGSGSHSHIGGSDSGGIIHGVPRNIPDNSARLAFAAVIVTAVITAVITAVVAAVITTVVTAVVAAVITTVVTAVVATVFRDLGAAFSYLIRAAAAGEHAVILRCPLGISIAAGYRSAFQITGKLLTALQEDHVNSAGKNG